MSYDFSAENDLSNSADAFAEILNFVKENRGLDFSAYRSSMISRRLSTRMISAGMPDYSSYASFLKNDLSEIDRLVDAFTINVSRFFRNPFVFEALSEIVLPAILEACRKQDIRIWSAGCGRGEEPYSVAILLRELLLKEPADNNVFILATDIDEEALAAARCGAYGNDVMAEVRKSHLDKYFTRAKDDLYMVSEPIREMVHFAFHDVSSGLPPKEGIFSDYHLILCRNVLIYFDVSLQEKTFSFFSGLLNRTGYLALGEAESISMKQAGDFSEIAPRTKIFRKVC